MKRRLAYVASLVLLLAVYFAAGRFGLSLALVHPSASAVWPPTGLAMAALLLWGYRLWPAVFVGALLVNLASSGMWLPSLGIALGNTCEALAGACLVNRFGNGANAFDHPQFILRFFAAAVISTAISATFGVIALILAGSAASAQFLSIWFTWWLGDLVSALIVAPLIIIWIKKPLPSLTKNQAIEAAVLLLIIAVLAVLIFFQAQPVVMRYQLKYLALPPIIWAAFRFGLHGAIASAFGVCAVALWGALRVPLTGLSTHQSVLLLQAFMGTVTLTSLTLAAALLGRRQTERALRENEARKSAILDSSLDCIITIDDESRILEVNSAAEKVFGYTRAEMLGKEMVQLIVPERYRAAHLKGLAHYLATREGPMLGRRIELSAIRRDGSEFPIELGIVPIRREGKPLFTGTLRDITERKRAEEALRRTLDFNEAVVTNMGEGLYTVDTGGLVTFMNPAAEKLFGWTLAELKGKKMHDMTHYRHRDGRPFPVEECAGFQVLRNGVVLTDYEDCFIRKDGTFFDVVYSSSPLREGREIVGLVVVFRDITERKRAQTELQKAQEELRHQNEKLEETVQLRTAKLRETIGELESYSYSISHDMRAPLRAMQAYSQVLLTDYGDRLDSAGKRYLDRIVGSANRLDKLIQDVLSYSRIARAEVILEPVNLDRLIDDIVNEYPAVHAAEVEICNPLGSVVAAEALLTQCLSNLLTNAAKFVKPNEQARIKVWTEELDPAAQPVIRLFIQDHGIGIAPKDQQRIFGIFARVHSEKEYEGTGIGLSIVKKAVDRMGGRLGLESELGQGSTFWLQLPKA